MAASVARSRKVESRVNWLTGSLSEIAGGGLCSPVGAVNFFQDHYVFCRSSVFPASHCAWAYGRPSPAGGGRSASRLSGRRSPLSSGFSEVRHAGQGFARRPAGEPPLSYRCRTASVRIGTDLSGNCGCRFGGSSHLAFWVRFRVHPVRRLERRRLPSAPRVGWMGVRGLWRLPGVFDECRPVCVWIADGSP